MIETALSTILKYLTFYSNFLISAWNNITPMQYGGLLIVIATIGWLLMKSSLKR